MTRSDRGAAAVEFALLLPVMAVLLVGGINLGLLAIQRQTANSVTIEAASYGAETADSPEPGWPGRVLGIARSSHESASACVARIDPGGAATWWRENASGAESTGPGKCWDDDRPADEARVQVQTEETGTLEAVLYAWDVDMTVRSIAAIRTGAPNATPSPSPTP